MLSRLSNLAKTCGSLIHRVSSILYYGERRPRETWDPMTVPTLLRVFSSGTEKEMGTFLNNEESMVILNLSSCRMKQKPTSSIVVDEAYLEKTKASNLLLTIERQGESLSLEDVS